MLTDPGTRFVHGINLDWLGKIVEAVASIPRDYTRFEQAMLRGGELDGVRILAEETVDAAFRNQIGDLDFPADIPRAIPG